MAERTDSFQPQDTLANTARTAMMTTAAGAFIAGIQNTLRKQNVGAMGIITRSGHIIAIYGAVGAAYQFSRDSSANLRQKKDAYNEAVGGFVGGTALGVAKRSIPFMLGAGVSLGVVMSAANYLQGLRGYRYDQGEGDEVERREALKKLRRRPVQETIEELGEGRGLYAPGYEERRRERLLARYGVDVGEAQGAK